MQGNLVEVEVEVEKIGIGEAETIGPFPPEAVAEMSTTGGALALAALGETVGESMIIIGVLDDITKVAM